MRFGNTDRAVTVSDPSRTMGKAIGQRLAHLGSLDCDVMATGEGYAVLDLNPRFGGGYPFSHLAGANLRPRDRLGPRRGAEASWLRTRPGVLVSKYDGVVVMDQAVSLRCLSA